MKNMNEQQQKIEQWRKDLWELADEYEDELPMTYTNRLHHITNEMWEFSHKRTWWQRIKYKLGLIN